MSMNNPYTQYQQNQLTTATPGKLLILLFDAAIRFANTAAEKMNENKLDEQSVNIRKVQNILLELISSLDKKAGPEMAANLQGVYNFMFDQLTHANIHDDKAALNKVIRMLTELRDTWAEAELIVRSGGKAKIGMEARAA